MKPLHVSRTSLGLALATVGALSSAGAAHADMKFVSRMSVSGGPRTTPEQTVVTLYKNSLVRTDTARQATIYDTKAQTITSLNKANKTYRVISLNSAFGRASGVLSKVKFVTTANITPQNETKVIAGKPARKYAGKITLQMLTPGMSPENAPVTTMELEQWSTEAVALPVSAQALLSPVMRMAGPLQRLEGMQPVVDALSHIKGAPLSSKVSVTPAGKSAAPGTIVTSNEVISVSNEPLSAALFQVPRDYKKVTVRSLPTFPKKMANGHAH